MQPNKFQRIDFSKDYPCPCRRRGSLVPIALTEAFGCNRCQQIFVIEDNGYVIEQLSTTYPYKRAWRWTGYQWVVAHSGIQESYFSVAIALVVILLVIVICLLVTR